MIIEGGAQRADIAREGGRDLGRSSGCVGRVGRIGYVGYVGTGAFNPFHGVVKPVRIGCGRIQWVYVHGMLTGIARARLAPQYRRRRWLGIISWAIVCSPFALASYKPSTLRVPDETALSSPNHVG